MMDPNGSETVQESRSIARIAVIGAGSWGTALALLAQRCGHEVRLWSRRGEHAERMRDEGENRQYLPGYAFEPGMVQSSELGPVLKDVDLVICAIPSHHLRSVVRRARADLLNNPGPCRLMIASKGVEVDSLRTMAEVVQEELGLVPGLKIAVLGGPSFSAEVAAQLPTAVVVASSDLQTRREIQRALVDEAFRIYISDDVLGVELGGAFKNVIALAAGINDGAGLGQNARSALITRGLAETQRLALALGANPITLSGLAGVGDLILTCTGGLSRNRKVGMALGRGENLSEILENMGMVAEGVRNTKSVYQLAQREGVEMPVVETMHGILYSGLTIQQAVRQLMHRALKAE